MASRYQALPAGASRYSITIKPKEQLKHYSFHIVAPSPNYYQMDIAFFGGKDDTSKRQQASTKTRDEFKYLIIIGVNNRYVWAVKIKEKTKEEIMRALDLFTMSETFRNEDPFSKPLIYIDCDGEKSFQSLGSNTYDTAFAKIIIISKPDPYHNRLSLINRVISTIRHFAFKMFDATKDIDLVALEEVLHQYNNRPHRTLSRLIGFNVTPKMLLDDIELEGFIAKKLMYLNLMHEKKKYKIGDAVMVAHMTGPFEKKRFEMEPGVFKITGYKNRMYIVAPSVNRPEDDQSGDKKRIVPGFYLAKL
jgi:hypothetical protein